MIGIKNMRVPEYTPIVISLIILIVLVRFKITNPFWDKQPVMRHHIKREPFDSGIICKAPIFNIKLKSNQKILLNNYSITKIKLFLQNNFSNNYNTNNNYLDYILRKKHAVNISLLEDNKIIGFIHSSPILVYIDKKLVKFKYVDYLCIDEKYRDNYMATILIASIIKVEKRTQPIMFKKDYSRLPYQHFISSNYYINDLRKLIPTVSKQIQELTPFNFYKYYDYTNKLLERYHIKSLYTKREFFNLFLGKTLMNYIIVNNSNGNKTIIIGKKNIYRKDNIVLNCFEIDLIIGELRYLKAVNHELSNYLKLNGYNYICVAAIGSNIKFIKDNSYKKHSKVYYYTYNYCMPDIKASECVININ